MNQMTSLDPLSPSHRLPIFVDTMTFDDRHERFVRDFRRRMFDDDGTFSTFDNSEQRRREFNNDFDRMSRDFVHLRPRSAGGGSTTSSRLSRGGTGEFGGSRESLDDDATNRLIVDTGNNTRKFYISFDVREYRPDDISIKVRDNSTLVVEARHEEITDGNKRSREFSRTIRLPHDVNVDRLTSMLSRDGILTVQAPLPPRYITSSSGAVRVHADSGSNAMHSAPVSPKSFCSSMMGAVDKCQLSPSFSEVSTSTAFIPPTPVITTLATTPSSSLDSAYSSTGIADQTQFPTYITMPAGNQKMELTVDVGRLFCSEDIVVRVDGSKLTVEARRDFCQQQQQASRPEKCKLLVSREYELNCLLEPSSVEASLNATGKLRVTARVESATSNAN